MKQLKSILQQLSCNIDNLKNTQYPSIYRFNFNIDSLYYRILKQYQNLSCTNQNNFDNINQNSDLLENKSWQDISDDAIISIQSIKDNLIQESKTFVDNIIKKNLEVIENKFLQEKGTIMPDFIEQQSFTLDKHKLYQDTPYIHDFILPDNPTEYDQFVDNHFAFVSDFFPVNNIDVQSLLKNVNQSIKDGKHTSAIDIYKYWLRYLKDYNQDYKLYDFRNFNENGEFIQRNDQKLNDNILDDFISDIDNVISYDEAKAKREREQKMRLDAEQLLKSGKYVSEIDPNLGHN